MIKRILIIGAYGNFGGFISHMLARESNIQLILAGRNIEKAKRLAATLRAKSPPEIAYVDIYKNLAEALALIKPDIVIHTSGPYQGQDYGVARACIEQACHYIDLADARDFVAHIHHLDGLAKEKGVLVCAGASSVPCLSAAIIDSYLAKFKSLDKIEYAIATAQLTNRGLATTAAVLSYAGKPFKTQINGEVATLYGWLDLRWKRFWGLNLRPLGNCDIPDLAIFPTRYPSIKTIRFRAGLELKLLHLILVFMSWLVRLKVIVSLQPYAAMLLKISSFFDRFGKDDSGFYMTLSGLGLDGKPKKIDFDLVARHGDGLYIPSMPAILLAKKLANLHVVEVGAKPCLDLISLSEYLTALSEFNITWKAECR